MADREEQLFVALAAAEENAASQDVHRGEDVPGVRMSWLHIVGEHQLCYSCCLNRHCIGLHVYVGT